MRELVKMVPPEWIAIAFFLIGEWWAERKHRLAEAENLASRKRQGERLGSVEDAIAEVRGLLRALHGNGHGE